MIAINNELLHDFKIEDISLLAVEKLHEGGTYLGAVVAGGTECEMYQCDHSGVR